MLRRATAGWCPPLPFHGRGPGGTAMRGRNGIGALLVVLLATGAAAAGPGGNLLRNGDFQDDWLTLLPELKNHHWNYTTEVFNRRDYNPDGWRLSGKWEWLA